MSHANIFEATKFSTDNIIAINAFNDNYIWLIKADNNHCALVDPGDAQVCIRYLEENDLILSSILITHHHQDHVGGIQSLKSYASNKQWKLTVYGPENDGIALLDIKLSENDKVELPELNCQLSVLELPGHTLGHIAYVNEQAVFCGDTLFSGGCGRLFEGTPKQMLTSLNKLSCLPDGTKVYCAHEYTQANLSFAKTVEPNNNTLEQYVGSVNELRSKNIKTIPSTIGLEKAINPFLRSEQNEIINSAKKFTDQDDLSTVEVFAAIRTWKDNF